MRYAKEGVALDILLQAKVVAAGDADATAGTITVAVQKWKQADGEDGYYYTGSAWQAGEATVPSTQLSAHGHKVTIDAARMGSLAGFDLSARPASATAIGPTTWAHVLDDFEGVSADTIDAKTTNIPANPAAVGDIPTAVEIETQLEIAHGDGSWAYSPSGAEQVTITVNDGVDPVEGVQVGIYDVTNTTRVRQEPTNAAGQIVVAGIPDGAYKVRLSHSLYGFTVPEDLTVSGTTTDTYSGTALFTTVDAPSANLCRISGIMYDAGDVAVASAAVTAYALTPQITGGVRRSKVVKSTTTDVNGAFTLDLARSTTINLVCESANVDEELTVPDAASQDWATWT